MEESESPVKPNVPFLQAGHEHEVLHLRNLKLKFCLTGVREGLLVTSVGVTWSGREENVLSSIRHAENCLRRVFSASLQAIDIEEGRRVSTDRPPSFRLRHPAVAYLSKLRSGRAEPHSDAATDGQPRGPSKRRKTLHFISGGLLGDAGPKHRPSGCGSVQSSMMSETQKSLASLESMMSSASRQYKSAHRTRSSVGCY